MEPPVPSQRACLPCTLPAVAEYLGSRMTAGADLQTISRELATRYHKAEFGYPKGPGPTMLRTHMAEHIGGSAVVSAEAPVFAGDSDVGSAQRGRRVTEAVIDKGMDELEQGTMRVSAGHLLKAQDMKDKKAEREQGLELLAEIARAMTSQATAPPKYLADPEEAVIEGEVTEVPVEP